MNKRRRYKAKRRRAERWIGRSRSIAGQIALRADAFELLFRPVLFMTARDPPKFDVLYGVGSFRDHPRNV
jgi:hypothetical protein